MATKKVGKEAAPEQVVKNLKPSQIIAAPEDNPRFWTDGFGKPDKRDAREMAAKYFKSPAFRDLCKSFDSSNGPISPITVEENKDGTYTLLDGWSRHEWARRRAVRKPRLTLPTIVRKCETEASRVTYRVALNTARIGYSPLAEAAALVRVVDQVGSVLEAAKRTGMTRATITNRLNLMGLPPAVKRLLHTEKLLLSAADAMTKLPGFDAYVKASRGLADPAEKKESEQFEAAALSVVKQVDDRDRDATRKGKPITASHIWNMYNNFVGKVLKKKTRRKLAKTALSEITADAIIQQEPSGDSVDAFLVHFGQEIAEQLLMDKPDQSIIMLAEAKLIAMATVRGWACDLDVLELNVDSEGSPIYSDDVAMALNRDLVKEYVAQGFMRLENLVIPDGHELSDRAKWVAFIRQCQSLTQVILRVKAVSAVRVDQMVTC